MFSCKRKAEINKNDDKQNAAEWSPGFEIATTQALVMISSSSSYVISIAIMLQNCDFCIFIILWLFGFYGISTFVGYNIKLNVKTVQF